ERSHEWIGQSKPYSCYSHCIPVLNQPNHRQRYDDRVSGRLNQCQRRPADERFISPNSWYIDNRNIDWRQKLLLQTSCLYYFIGLISIYHVYRVSRKLDHQFRGLNIPNRVDDGRNIHRLFDRHPEWRYQSALREYDCGIRLQHKL